MLMPPKALEKWRSKQVQLPLWVSTVLCLRSITLLQGPGTEATSFHQSKEPSNGEKGRLRGLTVWGLMADEEESDEPTWSNSGIDNTALLTLEWRRPLLCRRGQVQKNCPGRLNLSSAALRRKPWGKDSLARAEGLWNKRCSAPSYQPDCWGGNCSYSTAVFLWHWLIWSLLSWHNQKYTELVRTMKEKSGWNAMAQVLSLWSNRAIPMSCNATN